MIVQNVAEILNIYENEFSKLSERYFVEFPWPDAERIAPFVENGTQHTPRSLLPRVMSSSSSSSSSSSLSLSLSLSVHR